MPSSPRVKWDGNHLNINRVSLESHVHGGIKRKHHWILRDRTQNQLIGECLLQTCYVTLKQKLYYFSHSAISQPLLEEKLILTSPSTANMKLKDRQVLNESLEDMFCNLATKGFCPHILWIKPPNKFHHICHLACIGSCFIILKCTSTHLSEVKVLREQNIEDFVLFKTIRTQMKQQVIFFQWKGLFGSLRRLVLFQTDPPLI